MQSLAMMLEETYVISDSFISAALLHGLVTPASAEKIKVHANQKNVPQSEAAHSLNLMDMSQIRAVQLLQNPTSLAPGYELKSLLGTGSMGMVFRARQVALDREVAIKTMLIQGKNNEKELARIRQEAKAIACLQHPNIVSAYDAGIHDGSYFIAMELIQGEDLSTYISDSGALSEVGAWGIARQVASALAHADSCGIVHRDVKPGNILLTQRTAQDPNLDEEFLAKVTDFGLAYRATEDQSLQMTATGTTLGTPAYVAPEQLDNSHVDARADIYALGATVIHMVTGNPPYHDFSPIKAIIAKTTGERLWREEYTERFQEISSKLLKDMTESDPDQRISAYSELIRRIDEVLKSLTGHETEFLPAVQSKSALKPKFKPQKKRFSKLFGAIAIGLVLTALGIFFSIDLRSSPSFDEMQLAAWKPVSLPVPLFNGLSVPVSFQRAGFWKPHLANDGSRVLAGMEGAQLTIPSNSANVTRDSSGWRFRAGLQPQAGGIGKITFRSSAVGPEIALRVDARQVKLVSIQDQSKVTELASSMRNEQTGLGSSENAIFWDCEVYRILNSLVFRVNGSVLGAVQVDTREESSLVLEAEQGETYFADLDIVEIHRLVN